MHRSLYEALGENIWRARKRQHMNQTQLGAAVGLTRTSITNIESGRQRPPIELVYAIARVLAVAEPRDLFPLKGEYEQ